MEGNHCCLRVIWFSISSKRVISKKKKRKKNAFSILQLFVTMKKKVWIAWVDIPCDDNVGSCNYPDVCALSPFKNTECPQIFKDNQIPCKCPVAKVFSFLNLYKKFNFPQFCLFLGPL